MPNRDVFGMPKNLGVDPANNAAIPFHLLGFGKGRHLKLGGMTKEEKVAQQLKAAENRVKKQMDAQERLKKELELVKAKDKVQMQKIQEREKVKAEVVAEYQTAANNFVAEEIAKAKLQMQQEMEKELQAKLAQSQMQQFAGFQQQSRPTFKDHVAQQLRSLGTQQVFDEMELVSEAAESQLEGSVDTMKEARDQRKKNKMAANMIGNRSDMSSQGF